MRWIHLVPKALIASLSIVFVAPNFANGGCDDEFGEWDPDQSKFDNHPLRSDNGERLEILIRDWRHRVLQLGILMRSRVVIDQEFFWRNSLRGIATDIQQSTAQSEFYSNLNQTLKELLSNEELPELLETLLGEFSYTGRTTFRSLFDIHPFRHLMNISRTTDTVGVAVSNSYYYYTRDLLLLARETSALRWLAVNAFDFPDEFDFKVTPTQLSELNGVLNYELGVLLTMKEAFRQSTDTISDSYLRLKIQDAMSQQKSELDDDEIEIDGLNFLGWTSTQNIRQQLVQFYLDTNAIILALIRDRQDLIGEIDFLRKN